MLDNPDFLFSPDEPIGGAAPAAAQTTSPQATATPPQPASTPPAATSPASPQASAGGAPAGVQPSAGTQTPAAPAQPSWLDNFRKAGFDAKDEADAQARLLQAYRDAERLRPLAPVLSDYQANAQQYRAWLAEQHRQAQQKAAQTDWTAQFWQPPQWDNAWRAHLTTDAQGDVVPVNGAPADLAAKYQAYQHYRNTEASKFLDNPFKYMEPAIRHIAQEIAQQSAQQGVGQYQETQDAQSFIRENANWLYDGTKVINPQTGQYQDNLSRWGQFFVQKLQHAAQNGVHPALQKEYALQAVQNAFLATPEGAQYVLSQQQAAAPAAPAAPPQTPRQAANGRFTAQANPPAPPSPNSGGNAVPTPQKVDRHNIKDVMLQRFRDNNVKL